MYNPYICSIVYIFSGLYPINSIYRKRITSCINEILQYIYIYIYIVEAEEVNKRHAIINDSGNCKVKKKTVRSNKTTARAIERRKKKLVETAVKR